MNLLIPSMDDELMIPLMKDELLIPLIKDELFIFLIKDKLPHEFIHWNCEAATAIAKNKSYNCNSRQMKLRHDVIKQLQKDEIIVIDYVKSD